MIPKRIFATRIKCYSLSRSLVCSLLCTTLMAGILDGRAALAAFGQTPTVALRVPELDAGFHLLYELKFEEARNHFEAWQKSHPEDPLGSASEAAAYLFEECYRQGVLTSEFFLDNKRFLGKIPLKPDPELRAAFFAADKQAQDLAQLRLKTNPDDPNALFAMTLSLGMLANYASLSDKHQLDSLKKSAKPMCMPRSCWWSLRTPLMLTLGWAWRITSSEVCRDRRSFSSASLEFTAIRKQGSSSSKSPPSTAIISGRLLRFCWRWRPCARKRQKWPAHNLRSLSRNSPKTPCLRKSWPSSSFLLQRRDDNDPARLPR